MGHKSTLSVRFDTKPASPGFALSCIYPILSTIPHNHPSYYIILYHTNNNPPPYLPPCLSTCLSNTHKHIHTHTYIHSYTQSNTYTHTHTRPSSDRSGTACEVKLCTTFSPLCETCTSETCLRCKGGYYLTGTSAVCSTCYDFDPRCAGCTYMCVYV